MLGREGPEAIKILTELGSESAPAGGPVAQGGWRHPASRARKGRRPRAAPRRRRGRGRACCRPGPPPPGPPCLPAPRPASQASKRRRDAHGPGTQNSPSGSRQWREARAKRDKRTETKGDKGVKPDKRTGRSPGSSPHLLAPAPPPLLHCFCYRLRGAVACRASQHPAAEGSKGPVPIGPSPARGSSPPRARHEGGCAVAKGDTAAGPAIGAAEAWFAARRPTLQRWKWVQQLSGWQKVCTP